MIFQPRHTFKNTVCCQGSQHTERLKKLNERNDKIEAWMTDEMFATVVQKNKMNVKWKSTTITHVDYPAIKHECKAYDKVVRRSIEVESDNLKEDLKYIK